MAESTLALRLGTVALNIAATVGVVATNKLLFNGSLPLTTLSLSWMHYFSGMVFSRVALALGAFEYKHVPWGRVFRVYSLNMLAIVCQNWSLQVNTIDMYQLMKAVTLPYSAIVDYVFKKQLINVEAGLVVAGITAGASLVAVQDVGALRTTGFGLMVALLSVAVTPLPIVMFGPLMRQYEVSSLQLFSQGSVAGTVVLAPVVLIEMIVRSAGGDAEDGGSADASAYATDDTLAENTGLGAQVYAVLPIAVVSCLSAYCINFTVNAMARDYAGVTYYVINNFKTTLILGMGVYVFGDGVLEAKKALGMLICVVGQFLYPFAKKKVWPWQPGAMAKLTESSSSSSGGSGAGKSLSADASGGQNGGAGSKSDAAASRD